MVEDYTKGFNRYETIAKALSYQIHSNGRTTPPKHLWRFTLALVYHESGFRRDVHEGIGNAARGDCNWTGPKDNRKRVPGSCRSHCLAQINLGPLQSAKRTIEGWGPKDLIGIDLESTKRCLGVAVRFIDGAYTQCHGSAACVASIYTGTADRDNIRIKQRVQTIYRLYSAPSKVKGH
jgi:hypothetical protein